jgi:metal-responsive CopG/Arc/MetJ family transcriptional regulator
MPPNIYEKVNKLVYKKKNSQRSQFYYAIFIGFVDNHHDTGQFKELFKDYLSSDEGRELMKNMMKEVLLDVLSHEKLDGKERKNNP